MLATLAEGQKIQLHTTHQMMMQIGDLKDTTRRSSGWSEGLHNRMVRIHLSSHISHTHTVTVFHSAHTPSTCLCICTRIVNNCRLS
jgi:hypothetical protein